MLNHRQKIIFSSSLIFLPMLIGFVLWQQLPDQLPTHFDLSGKPDDYSTKNFVVFQWPMILLAIHYLTLSVIKKYPKQSQISPKMLSLLYLITPSIALVTSLTSYGYALKWLSQANRLIVALLGFIFMAIGNYLPKVKQNYTVGVKLPWTLHDRENWEKTHRLAGRLFLVAGLLMGIIAFLFPQLTILVLPIVLIITFVPIVYSWRLAK